VLFVSHNMTAVQSLCSRAIHIADGQILGDGNPKDQIQAYLSMNLTKQPKNRKISVGDGLAISDVSLAPDPVEVETDLQIALALSANSSVLISEAALLFDSLEGPRIGIIDLRDAGFPFAMKSGDC